MAVHHWTCQRQKAGKKCGQVNVRRRQLCIACGKRRPSTKQPAHLAVLKELSYADCVKRYGEWCGICGALRTKRRLNRDHDHHTGKIRGLLCTRCNRNLPAWCDSDWLRKAAEYLDNQ